MSIQASYLSPAKRKELATRLPERVILRNSLQCPGPDGEPSPPFIAVVRFEAGYYPIYLREDIDLNTLNHGATPAQLAAMLTGSMFGWHCPGADPATYPDEAKAKAVLGAA